ncbi:MAG: putative DNA binding domain-containing protein [Victivallales bacterium]|nr:putative DNA binding domain-containing protein [Victivallales bacterium]
MILEEILRGETERVEFKESLPREAVKYVKTVVAFANCQGGQLVIGVADGTREVVGLDDTAVFATMDTIASAVSDCCTPQIVPDLSVQTVQGKSVVVATVSPGANRPYYLKSKGKEQGTYIRVGATTRLADPDKLKELELEGARISWDELPRIGYPVSESAVKKLCRAIDGYRQELQRGRAPKLPKVSREQLLNWNVLRDSPDGLQATNAFALLTGDSVPFARTQCAVFAGTTRGTFLDKRDYCGPLFEQVEESVAFVLRNIRLEAQVEGLIRREQYELPPEAIREILINAQCHRNFLEPSCVQVALYADRLEVTSPGGMFFGLTLEEALQGRSKQRNRAIAVVFSQMGLIEGWGTGLQKVQDQAKEYGLPAPQFLEMPSAFRVNLYRKPIAQTNLPKPAVEPELAQSCGLDGGMIVREDSSGNRYVAAKETNADTPPGPFLSATERGLLRLIKARPEITIDQMASQTGLSRSGVQYALEKLKGKGCLRRLGAQKNGQWLVTAPAVS